MAADVFAIAFGVVGWACLVSAFFHPWASDRLLLRLQYRHPETWRQLIGSVLPANHQTAPTPWIGLLLFRYVLSGRHRRSHDPVIRRYGAITLCSALGWLGSMAAIVLVLMIAWHI